MVSKYLRALREWDRRFPGFGHETHGIEVRDGEHFLYCLKQTGSLSSSSLNSSGRFSDAPLSFSM